MRHESCVLVEACAAGNGLQRARASRLRRRRNRARARSQAARGRGLHREDPQVHHAAVLHLAAGGLSARVEKRADAASGAWRHLRRAGNPALRGRRVQIHAPAGESHAAREGFLDWQDRRRARDDCRRGFFGRKYKKPGRKPRAPGQARRSPRHQARRRGSRQARRAGRAHLLHHWHDSFAPNTWRTTTTATPWA